MMPAEEPSRPWPKRWLGLALTLCPCVFMSCSGESTAASAAIELPQLLRSSLRRLTAAEYDHAASDLLGADVQPSRELPPSTALLGFDANADAAVDALYASKLADVARALAHDAATMRLHELSPCAAQAEPTCAPEFVETFGARAFRRPISSAERERLLGVFEVGQSTGDFSSGVELVLTTLLQSPSFSYLTEFGDEADSEAVARSGISGIELSPYEVAAQLAFALTGHPPDAELLGAAERRELDAAGRRQHAWRLLRQSNTRFQFRRFVAEWFGLAGAAVPKDPALFPQWPGLWEQMLDETNRFVDEVMIRDNGSVRTLLAGDTATGQAGLLQGASFASRYAHATDTAPVLRGVFVLRRLLCRALPNPAELGLEITFPEQDAMLTTRERYAAHSSDPQCAACHVAIDGIGFTFENYDAIGRIRDMEAGQPIDTTGSVELAQGRVEVGDSVELAGLLARDPEVEHCMQRQLLRFAMGRAEPQAELGFNQRAATLAEAERTSVISMLVNLVESELFARRRLE